MTDITHKAYKINKRSLFLLVIFITFILVSSTSIGRADAVFMPGENIGPSSEHMSNQDSNNTSPTNSTTPDQQTENMTKPNNSNDTVIENNSKEPQNSQEVQQENNDSNENLLAVIVTAVTVLIIGVTVFINKGKLFKRNNYTRKK